MTETSEVPKGARRKESAWSRPLEAARANLVPGLGLQAFAIAVVLAYYRHAPTREALDAVADFKRMTGYFYSFFATALFGGLIPWLWLRANPGTRAHTRVSHGVFLVLVWACKGVEVDAFYRLQSAVWGDGTDFATIVCKVVLDLFVYCPLWASPTTILLFQWKEMGFSFSAMRRLGPLGFLRRNLLTTLVATWSVWLPAVAVIYSLPLALQVPLFNIVLCFFSLLYSAMARKAG
ncbi:MAG TPA: hypothetical protein VK465_01760 [Fibrobacteria bacterium]|nr:hypothetical protein [Fibrobacteria bacterium]